MQGIVNVKITPSPLPQPIPEHWRQFADMASVYISKRKSDSTRLCYKNDFSLFMRWCDSIGAQALPAAPEVVAMYLAHIATEGKKSSTVKRRSAAIRFAHLAAGHDTPTASECVIAVMEGIRNVNGIAPQKKAAALVWHVEAMIAQCSDTIGGMRDRALISMCLAGGFRGSEPLSLNLEDLQRVPEGYIVTLRRAKNDQQGKGKKKAIMNGQRLKCAEWLRTWVNHLEDKGITSGALFRPILKSGTLAKGNERIGYRTFYNLIKKYAKQAGFDADLFGTHSLRRGFVTESFDAGATIEDTMGVTGHARYEEVLGYREEIDIFRNNPSRHFL